VRLHTAVVAHYDHSVNDGCRTVEEQRKNVAKGVSKTMASKHLPQADGKCHATDSMPYPAVDWGKVERGLAALRAIDPKLDLLRFYHFQGFVAGVAAMLGIDLRQGVDWDGDEDLANQSFFDLPHNELRMK
jgi:hypothetical protein